MPRTYTDPIWLHWTHKSGNGKKERVQCNYCKSNTQLKNAPKCKQHTIKCNKTPPNVKRVFITEEKNKKSKIEKESGHDY